MGAVGLVFAPLAPLVALAAAIVFWMSSWVYKYQLMFVFTSKVESGGVSPDIVLLENLVLMNMIVSAFGTLSLIVFWSASSSCNC